MEHIDQNIDIDLIDPVINVAYCNQYENASRRIICHVLKEGKAYNIPSNVSVLLRIHKANHYNLYENVNNIGEIDGNLIIIPLIPELTKSYGRHECIFEFVDTTEEKLLYSTKFYIRVAKSPIQNENIQDSHEYAALVDFMNTKGKANGIASLDENGKVPESQLPSYVDDVIEGYLSDENFYKEAERTTALSGKTGKIYVDLHTDKIYRWSDNAFTIISKDTDTKNTAGATADSGKLFLIGAKEQAANPQTYSHDTAYIGEDGCVYSGGNKVLTEHPVIALNENSVSTASPSAGETFTVVDSVTKDDNGHVIKINTKTVTLPDMVLGNTPSTTIGAMWYE